MNSNYEDFLALGRDLRGGDEKVEEVRLGVLGLRRELEGLKNQVKKRREEMERLVEDRRKVRVQTVLGRGLLEVERRVQGLEQRLMLVPKQVNDASLGDVSDTEDSEEDEECGVETRKLRLHAEQYVHITKLVKKFGPEHPFLVTQEGRISRLRQTVLLDMGNALKQAMAGGDDEKGAVMKILEVYRMLDEPKEALGVLKEARKPRSIT